MSVREGYKQTEIGNIPEEWEVVNLNDLVYRPLAYGVLKPGEYDENGVYMLRIQDIKTNTIDYNSLFRIPKSLDLEFKRTKLNEGDLILSLVGTIGKVLKINDKLAGANVTRAFGVIGIKEKQSIDYIEQYLKSFFIQKWIIEQSKGNAQKVFNIEDIKKLPVIFPSLPEQQKIAEILSTVDQKIDSIDSKIEETQSLKQGLMQRLLSEGIGHSEFKESEIGRIPMGWEVIMIEDIADVKGGKRLPKGSALIEEKTPYPYIRVTDMHMGGVNTAGILYVPIDIQPQIKNYTISKDDLFISVAGTLGIVGEVPEELHNANLTENADKLANIKINKKYLLYILLSDLIQNEISKQTTSNAQPKLALTRIKTFKIPVPPKEEQNQIAKILSTTDEKLETLRAKKEAFEILKKGLMQKLLGGEVRVAV